MTDRSFGDYTNRNIVKNPLLSTAVTGLSIEDLTHNAVILPVSLRQEVTTRPDQQFGSQARTLANPENVAANYPSGDANSNPTASNAPSNIHVTPINTTQNIKTEKFYENPISTQSKAFAKTDDDFDVNEYFARLQGTIYVSAPLNSNLIEDANVNLETAEENLEEINLNEPDKSQTDFQHSLTADIAQNFSQLPTVLPQVASAVFSSFSNMLNMKSKENTPDEPKAYPNAQFQEETVPLMGVSEYKDMGPPPKELPISGSGNYRLTTKKKYAQIPGLSSAQMPTNQSLPYNPIGQNIPSYFVPSNLPDVASSEVEHTAVPKTIEIDAVNQMTIPTNNNESDKDTTSIFKPYSVPNIPITEVPVNQPNIVAANNQTNIFVPADQPVNNSSQFYSQALQSNMPEAAAKITPPPMFSNFPREDSQSVGKSILPPSVARRISANKPQAHQALPEQFFVPTATDVSATNSSMLLNSSISPLTDVKPPSAFASFSTATNVQDISIFTPATSSLASTLVSVPASTSVTSMPASLPSGVVLSGLPSATVLPAPPVQIPSATNFPSATFNMPPSNLAQNMSVPPRSALQPTSTNIQLSTSIIEASVAPAIFTPASIPQSQLDTKHLPAFFNPSTISAPPRSIPPISANVPSSTPITEPSVAMFTPASIPQSHSDATPPMFFNPSTISAPPRSTMPPISANLQQSTPINESSVAPTMFTSASIQQSHSEATPPMFFNPSTISAPPSSIIPPISANVPSSTPIIESYVAPTMFTPASIPQSYSDTTPPSFFNPSTISGPPRSTMPPMSANVQSSNPIIESSVAPIMFTPASLPQSQSDTKLPPAFFNPSTISAHPKSALPPMSANIQQTTPIIESSLAPAMFTPASLPQSHADMTAPPTFFNPSTLTPIETPEIQSNMQKNIPGNTAEFLAITTPVAEPPKPVIEPPKISGNANYRMTKKRPQYYAGPIEGIGAISNNVKPILQPVGANAFQGALFTPTQQIPEAVDQNLSAPNVNKATVPFDINRPAETPAYTFEAKPQEQMITQPEYSTAFDFSRPPTDTYEPPKQESKGFGIIGSLKSKLSSLDINKIQNTVTTFFDPAYNDTKKEEAGQQENVPYGQQPVYGQGSYGAYSQNQSSSFEIFVPTVDSTPQQYAQSYNYQTPYQNQDQVYGQAENQQYYQNTYNYYQNQGQNIYPASSGNILNIQQDMHVPELNSQASISNVQENVSIGAGMSSNDNLNTDRSIQGTYNVHQSRNEERNVQEVDYAAIYTKENVEATALPAQFVQNNVNTELESSVVSFFDNLQELSAKKEQLESMKAEVQTAEVILDKIQESAFNIDGKDKAVEDKPSGNVSNFSQNQESKRDDKASANFTFEEDLSKTAPDIWKQDLQPSDSKPLDVSSVALLGLSTMLADKSKELVDLENDIKSMTLDECKNIDTIFSRGDHSSFFDDMNLESKPANKEKINDLNIREACREVDKPDDMEPDYAEPDDLTAHLIENITSPIQLLNPVEVPLTESNTPVDDRDDFDSSQCAEISHITEETIETIQIQSATELLDDDEVKTNVRSYGWYTEASPFAPKEIAENDYGLQMKLQPTNRDYSTVGTQNPITHHDYSLHTNSTVTDQDFSAVNPGTIGFLGNNPLFRENIPNNASDELKAEFKFTYDEPPAVLTRQMSIPTAPPADEDNKSEAGLDVNSIELDAKQDFPVFGDFYIEPSETDDDKIEYKVREKSTDEIQDMDSFTNRIERFKKLGESSAEAFDLNKNSPFSIATTSPTTLHMASYFDTGNYAAETHYRNSLTSPNFAAFILNSPSTLRVPPGFEEEYQRRMSEIAKDGAENKDIPYSIPYIPDCSTQTRPTYSPTFSTASNHSEAIGSTVTRMSDFVCDNKSSISSEKVADFDRTFEDEAGLSQSNIQTEIPSIFTAPKDLIYNAPINIPGLDLRLEGDKLLDFSDILDVNQEVGLELNASKWPPAFSAPKTTFKEVPVQIKDVTSGSSNIFAIKQELPHATQFVFTTPEIAPEITYETSQLPGLSNVLGIIKEELHKPPENVSVFAKLEAAVEKAPEKLQAQGLPIKTDPINFFTKDVDPSADKSSVEDPGFNRLASYFTTPAKTDNPKSFFELSLGQDHYRHHKTKSDTKETLDTKGDTASNVKSFFELSQTQNHYIDQKQNIPQDKYLANMNLIKDLTSIQNIEVDTDQVVRTVNYFTVEYNKECVDSIGEPETIKKEAQTKYLNKELEETQDDETINKIINNCKCCCNVNVNSPKYINLDHESVFTTDLKVKKGMDNSTEAKKESEGNMEQNKDTSNKYSVTVNFGNDGVQEESNESATVITENRGTGEYTPVKHHWFYRVDVEGKSIWRGFSVLDTNVLEEAYHSPDLDDNTLVPTDGGRYDVNVVGRLRVAVYWADKPANVRRCSWFYKGNIDARYVPYTEAVAEKLEEEYRHGVTTGEWHRRLLLPNNELVVMHGPAVMVHFVQNGSNDAFSGPPLFAFGKRVYRNPPKIRVLKDQPEKIDHLLLLVHGAGEYRHQMEKKLFQSTERPRVVRRGCDETEIEDCEPSNIDHLLLLCHGIGSACDMRFRSVEEVVEDFRSTSLQLLQSHYRNSFDNGSVGRIEVLPISWHATLHSGETGVDRRLARITLDSIPRLRTFTNDTVLDVLFYTSPVFCQTIIDTVCKELNRIHDLFRSRNPNFTGGVSVGGHSLGSVILYDLLCHQLPTLSTDTASDKTYVTGAAGTGQPSVKYPKLVFSPVALYALGSPIAIFECIRGVDYLGSTFALPTCPNFFNIFHPYDPIAYRIEPLINPHLRNVKPFLIPHHKGRKRMHLELRDTMARVGADIKQKLIESIKTTWSNMWKTQPAPTDRQLEKVVEEEMEKEGLTETREQSHLDDSVASPDMLGQLNGGRRIDYVLQEAPLEMINEYLFAMSSHVCYWESEDTMLMILREIYDSLGVQPDCTVPQQSMTVQRTRLAKNGETIAVNVTEHPSTSRDST